MVRRILAALGAALFIAVPVAAQVTTPAPAPKIQLFDNNGLPCTGCKLFTYSAGTTTKQNTYTDSTGATANVNPVVLNTRGEANVWLTPGLSYKFVFSPSTDTDPPTNPFWTVDNLGTSVANSFNPLNYGAKCDGATDDTTAFRNLVAAFNLAKGGTIQVPTAICKIDVTAGPLILTAGGSVQGNGIPGIGGGLGTIPDSQLTGSSVIRDVSASTNDVFQVQTGQSVEFRNFMLDFLPTRTTGGAGIAWQGVQPATAAYTRSPALDRMVIRGEYDGVRSDYAALWSITRSYFLDYSHCGLDVNVLTTAPHDAGAFDYGSGGISGNWFWDLNVTTGLAGYCHFVGSLGPVIGNDFTGGQYGFYTLWGSSHSEELRLIGNLFDQHTKANVGIFQAAAGDDLSEVIIANNHFTTQVFAAASVLNPKYGNVYVDAGTAASFDDDWVKLLNIQGNTFNNCYDNSQGASAYIWLKAGQGVNVQGNVGTMNYNPGIMPCTASQGAGVNAIRTDGTGNTGPGVINCQISGNLWTDSPSFEFGGLAPLCVVDEALYKTFAANPNLGYNRTIQRAVQLDGITAWSTVLTLTPSTVTGLTTSGLIQATLSGHTAAVGHGTRTAQWQYLYASGTPSVQSFAADACKDNAAGSTNCPQFRLVVSGNNIQIQVQSANGTGALDGGSAMMVVELAAVNGVATTFTWTLQ